MRIVERELKTARIYCSDAIAKWLIEALMSELLPDAVSIRGRVSIRLLDGSTIVVSARRGSVQVSVSGSDDAAERVARAIELVKELARELETVKRLVDEGREDEARRALEELRRRLEEAGIRDRAVP